MANEVLPTSLLPLPQTGELAVQKFVKRHHSLLFTIAPDWLVLLAKRSSNGSGISAITAALGLPGRSIVSVVTRLVRRNSSRDSSCRSSQGGTFSDSDSKSPAPPMSKVYLARRPISRSTIVRSSAL